MRKNIIRLAELTTECLESFLNDEITSCFLNEDCKKLIREEFKKFKKTGDCSIDFKGR